MICELTQVGTVQTNQAIELNVAKAERNTRISRICGAVLAAVGIIGGGSTFAVSVMKGSGSGEFASVGGGALLIAAALKLTVFSRNLFDRATLNQNYADFANLSLPDFVYLQKKQTFHSIESLQKLGFATAADANAMHSLCERYKECSWKLTSNVTSSNCEQVKPILQQIEQEWDELKSELLTHAGIQV